jgi:hypothetical protein
MKLEPIDFGVGELTLEKLGLKRPEPEPSKVSDEPDVSEPIEEPEMAEPAEPAESFEAQSGNEYFKNFAGGFFEDLISFVSNNYMALGTLALVGSIGFYAGRRYVSKGESRQYKED